jgi:hypothetical protein
MIICMGMRALMSGLFMIRILRGRIVISESLVVFLCWGCGVVLIAGFVVVCRGSALQQAVSALTVLPPTMFQGTGQNFTTMGQSTINRFIVPLIIILYY